MKVSGFHEAVAAVFEKDPRFRPEGYQFLRESLESTIKKRVKGKQATPPSQHVSAAELLDGFRKRALKEFGPMATTVLDFWGIHSCGDIGEMVFLLVEAGAFGRTEEDNQEAFKQGFDFHEAFVAPFQPPVAGPTPQGAEPSQTSLFSK